ncbi:hypothetical protein VTO42DRAFT_5553 [Malbranchea cinnamomea]
MPSIGAASGAVAGALVGRRLRPLHSCPPSSRLLRRLWTCGLPSARVTVLSLGTVLMFVDHGTVLTVFKHPPPQKFVDRPVHLLLQARAMMSLVDTSRHTFTCNPLYPGIS